MVHREGRRGRGRGGRKCYTGPCRAGWRRRRGGVVFIGDGPRRNAFRYPDAVAWRSDAGTWTWAEANARINQLAHALAGRGLRPGDRLGVLAYPSHRVVETY